MEVYGCPEYSMNKAFNVQLVAALLKCVESTWRGRLYYWEPVYSGSSFVLGRRKDFCSCSWIFNWVREIVCWQWLEDWKLFELRLIRSFDECLSRYIMKLSLSHYWKEFIWGIIFIVILIICIQIKFLKI